MALFSKLQLHLLLLLLVLPNSAFSQTNNNITVGTTLTATDSSSPWTSSSGDFAFGFRKLQGQNDLFLLSIWYVKTTDKTVVWYATNGSSLDSPAVRRGSRVSLAADRGLVLADPQGKELWSSETVGRSASYAVMGDDGNMVIFQENGSVKVWESFGHPTDTLLPGQTMSRGQKLWSRWREREFSRGRFQLSLQQDGDLAVYSINLPTEDQNNPYYVAEIDDGNRLVLNETGITIC